MELTREQHAHEQEMMRLKVSLASESMRKTHDSQFTTPEHVSGVNPFMQVPPQQQHQFNNITILNAYKEYAASEIEKNNVTSKKGEKSTVVISGKKRSIKGISMAKSTLLDLIKRLGADVEMWRVTNDVIEQKWVNTRLKENTHKGKPPELTTLKRDLSFIRTFFAWGAETKRRYCETLDIFIDATPCPRDKFTAADLQKIFTVLPTLAAKPWQFWVPLIQLYTGARTGELSALSVDHFRNEAGIEVMHQPGTKSDSAARDIPIHPDLIKIGLIEFVEMRRKKGCATLFDLSISEQNGAGAAVTKFFSDFLRDKVGITNSGKVNHSFRHTLVRHLFQHSSPIEARKQYVGHSNNSGTEGTYLGTELLNLPDLKIAVVDKIDWQKYYGWSPDIAVLSAKAKEFL